MAKYALGQCDRCSFDYPLHELRFEIYDGVRTGTKVCPTCYDKDHPQLRAGLRKLDDPKPPKDARPDRDSLLARNPAGWNPVQSILASTDLGEVTVA